MMTIKVIQHLLDGENVTQKGAPRVFLFSGDEIQYKPCFFEDQKTFVECYLKEQGDLSAHVIGVPDGVWGEGKVIKAGYFTSIFYTNGDGDLSCIVCQNSTVYIMEGRQTVDSIHMEEYQIK